MPEKVAVLSKIRLLLFISPKFTTCRYPRAICRKDTAVRIEADGYFLWLEKWIMQCYFVTSAVKKVSTNFPQCGVCFLSVSCLIIARCRRSGGYQNVFSGSISHHHLKKITHLARGAFFIWDVEEITTQAVNDAKQRGVETSGSTSLAMCVSAAKAIHLPPPS